MVNPAASVKKGSLHMSDLNCEPLRDQSLYEELDKKYGRDICELHDKARRIAESAKYCLRKYSRERVEDGMMTMKPMLLYCLVPTDTEPVPPGLEGRVDQWDAATIYREMIDGAYGKTSEASASAVVRVPAALVVDAIDFRLAQLRQRRAQEEMDRKLRDLRRREGVRAHVDGCGARITRNPKASVAALPEVGQTWKHRASDATVEINTVTKDFVGFKGVSGPGRWRMYAFLEVYEPAPNYADTRFVEQEMERADRLRKRWKCGSCVHKSKKVPGNRVVC